MEEAKKEYFKVSLSMSSDNGENFLYFRIMNKIELPSPKNKTILMLIDKSGSMAGDNMDHTKLVLKKFLDYFRVNLPDANINLFIYDTDVTVIKEALKIEESQVTKLIDGIKAGGGTYFGKVLGSMAEFIERKKENIKDLSIIFMTDGRVEYGMDTQNNFENLNKKFDELKQQIAQKVDHVDLHAIGLGKDHDPFFLEKVVMINKQSSTFQFIINETGINPSFNAVKDCLCFNNITGQILLSDDDSTNMITVELQESEFEGKRAWEGLIRTAVDVSKVNLSESCIYVDLVNGGRQEKFYLKEIFDRESGCENAFKIQLMNIKEKLTKIFNDLKDQAQKKKFSVPELDEMCKKRTEIKHLYQSIAVKLYKVKNKEAKNTLFKMCEAISPLFEIIDDLFTSSYKNEVKSVVLGKAIQLAHKNINKQKYIDELESRLPTTVRLFNGQDTEIKRVSEGFKANQEILEKQYADILDEYNCFLTCNNFVEAIAEEDCLCLSFGIVRSEQAIFVPSSIKIIDIYPTVVSAQSFLNSIKYSINLNFKEQSEQVIKGSANESINAALPLYINEDHWRISELLMDRILGWICTLDPMGYHISQTMTFPYILLEFVTEKCFKNPTSDFYKKYFKQVLDICLRLMVSEDKKKDSNFKENLLKLYDSYVKYGTVRTPDSISKSSFFFIKFFCAKLLGWVKVSNDFFNIYYYLIEEELRRIQTKAYHSFGEFVKMDLNNPESFSNDDLKKETIVRYTTEYKELYDTNCILLKVIRYLFLTYDNAKDIDFNSFKLEEGSLLKDLNLKDEFGLYAMIFQNQITHESSVRRKYFTDNLYFDCRVAPEQVLLTYNKAITEIKEKRTKQLEVLQNANVNQSDLRKRFNKVDAIALLKEFRICTDLTEARDLIKKARAIKSGKAVYYYYQIFYNLYEIPLLYEKLVILKEEHPRFQNAIKFKHMCDLYYSNHLTEDEIIEVFDYRRLPRERRAALKDLYVSN